MSNKNNNKSGKAALAGSDAEATAQARQAHNATSTQPNQPRANADADQAQEGTAAAVVDAQAKTTAKDGAQAAVDAGNTGGESGKSNADGSESDNSGDDAEKKTGMQAAIESNGAAVTAQKAAAPGARVQTINKQTGEPLSPEEKNLLVRKGVIPEDATEYNPASKDELLNIANS